MTLVVVGPRGGLMEWRRILAYITATVDQEFAFTD